MPDTVQTGPGRGMDRPAHPATGKHFSARSSAARILARNVGLAARLVRGKRRTGETADDDGSGPTNGPGTGPGPRRAGPSASASVKALDNVQKINLPFRPTREGSGAGRSHAHDAIPRTKRTVSGGKTGLSFALAVLLPLAIVMLYMASFARPQFVSSTAFAIRSADMGLMQDALSGIARMAGGNQRTDAVILAEFLESQTLLERLSNRVDLSRHYTEAFTQDPVFALSPNASIEGRLRHWRRVLQVQNDPATGLIELHVHAFSPEMAQLLTRELLVESRMLLNDLNRDIRAAQAHHAEAELSIALDRLAQARADLSAFRIESGQLDARSDLDNRTDVIRHLQGQLAVALAAQDAQRAANGTDQTRVASLQERIDAERARLVSDRDPADRDGPRRLEMQERLEVEKDFAEMAYQTALASRNAIVAQSRREDRFLAVYVEPTLAERFDHRKPIQIIALAAVFLTLIWTIAALVRAAVADRF